MVGEHCDYKRHRRGPKAGLACIILILLLPSLTGGWEWRGWAVKWLKAGVQAGQTGLQLDTSPSIPVNFLEMARGLYAVPVPSSSQSPDRGRQNVPDCGGAGNNMGRAEEGHRKCGRDSQGAGPQTGGDSGTCDLIR